MFDFLSVLGTLFGSAAGTFELIGGAWGWLEMIVNAVIAISEFVTPLLG